jgi:ribonuclease P protein component
VRAARSIRRAEPSLTLEIVRTPEARRRDVQIRYGVTASRRVGGAIERNRAKRRLRAAARAVLPLSALAGNDYVLVARRETLTRPFAALVADLATALSVVHARQRQLESGVTT